MLFMHKMSYNTLNFS